MKKRVYVCHTFYHIYVTFLKELYLPEEKRGQATLVISHMSCDFGDFPDRLRQLHFFEDVVDFDEKGEKFFPELDRYRHPSNNFVVSIWNRACYTKKLARYEAKYIPVNFKDYEDIYVFCDSDPIGFYLNQNRIKYHAVEDGLNCLSHGDLAHIDNIRHFGVKAFLSQKCNLIFIQNGYSKYCIDMEVNDISKIQIPFEKYKEVPRKELVEHLTKADKELLLKAFVKDCDELQRVIADKNQKTALILTEPLCDLTVRKQIFQDIIERYQKEYRIILKPHPRDLLDYEKEFSNTAIIEKTVPMEMMNFFEDCKIDLAVGVFTEMSGMDFAQEKIRLGLDFMDQYEDPALHRQAEVLKDFKVK